MAEIINQILQAILVIDGVIISLWLMLVIMNILITAWDKKFNPTYPKCDIDPRCHPWYIRLPDGKAWIGNVEVRQ